MSDVAYRGHRIALRSYKLADGRWVPEAHVRTSTGAEEHITPVRGKSGTSFETEAEANAEAKRLAIAWIGSH